MKRSCDVSMNNSYITVQDQFVEKLVLFLMFVTFLLRGTTFLQIISTHIYGLRISYILVVVSLFVILLKKRKKTTYKQIVFTMFLFIFVFISSLINQSFNNQYIVFLITVIALYKIWELLVLSIDMKVITSWLLALLILTELFSLLEIIVGKSLFHSYFPYSFNSIFSRAFVFFFNPNNLSLFLVLLTAFIVFTRKISGIFFYINCTFEYFILLSNDSKLSIIVLTGLVIYFLVKHTHISTKVFIYVVIFVFVIFTTLKMFPEINDWLQKAIASTEKSFENQTQVDPRFVIYREAIRSSFQNPLGIGLGASDEAFQTNVHSVLLQLLVELGIFGYIIWFLYYSFFLRILLMVFREKIYLIDLKAIVVFVLLIPVLSSQVSRMISDMNLMSIWMLFTATSVIYYRNNPKLCS